MLSDPACSGLLVWEDKDNHGTITIIDYPRLKSTLFPKYFPRASDKSFIRQLNLHGFKRILTSKEVSYVSPLFLQSRPDLHSLIHRNKRSPKSVSTSESPKLHNLTLELSSMRAFLEESLEDPAIQTLALLSSELFKPFCANICRLLYFLSNLKGTSKDPISTETIIDTISRNYQKDKLLVLFRDYISKIAQPSADCCQSEYNDSISPSDGVSTMAICEARTDEFSIIPQKKCFSQDFLDSVSYQLEIP